jgi:hypothetical protein
MDPFLKRNILAGRRAGVAVFRLDKNAASWQIPQLLSGVSGVVLIDNHPRAFDRGKIMSPEKKPVPTTSVRASAHNTAWERELPAIGP